MAKIWKPKIELDEYYRDNGGYIRGDRPCTKILIHYMFTLKYRRDVSKIEGVCNALGHYLERICWQRKWHLETLAVEGEHCHILIQLPPTVSVSYGAQILKGVTSKLIRELYPELKDAVSGKAFWGKHYYAKTVGDVDFERTKEYINGQGKYRCSIGVGLQPKRR